jgi:hypothetical protein
VQRGLACWVIKLLLLLQVLLIMLQLLLDWLSSSFLCAVCFGLSRH